MTGLGLLFGSAGCGAVGGGPAPATAPSAVGGDDGPEPVAAEWAGFPRKPKKPPTLLQAVINPMIFLPHMLLIKPALMAFNAARQLLFPPPAKGGVQSRPVSIRRSAG